MRFRGPTALNDRAQKLRLFAARPVSPRLLTARLRATHFPFLECGSW